MAKISKKISEHFYYIYVYILWSFKLICSWFSDFPILKYALLQIFLYIQLK